MTKLTPKKKKNPKSATALPLRLEWRTPSELAENPRNWRRHPDSQLAALADVIGEVGWAGACLFNERTQRLIDGHARQKIAKPGEKIPVLVGSWSEEDERKILATLDPLASMAEADAAALDALLRDVQTSSQAVGDMLTKLAEEAGVVSPQDTREDGTKGTGKVFRDDAIIEAAFQHFRRTGFPYRNLPVHVSMQEINRLAESEDPWRTDIGYQVADTYHPHRFRAAAEGMKSPTESFEDDGQLKRAIRIILEAERSVPAGFFDGLKLVSGTQACSNFRPGFALLLYRRFAPAGATVLDTSTGYGGRLIGFMASGLARYIGIDPNTETHAGNLRMAADLGFSDRVELHNLPAEDVPHATLAGRCDFAFTSPPYFRKEHYSDEPTQSWKRYSTGQEWRSGFLGPMLRLQFAALKSGCCSVVNIADVTIKGQIYPLAKWTIAEANAAGFEHEGTDKFPMQKRFGAGHDDEVATEPVLVFRKPEKAT